MAVSTPCPLFSIVREGMPHGIDSAEGRPDAGNPPSGAVGVDDAMTIKPELAELDKIVVEKNGWAKLRLGAALLLKFPESSAPARRRGFADCMRDYLEEMSETGLCTQTGSRLSRASKAKALDYIERKVDDDPDKDFEIGIVSELDDPGHPEATGVRVGGFVATRTEEQSSRSRTLHIDDQPVAVGLTSGAGMLGTIAFYNHAAWLVERQADYLVRLVLGWCNRLKPLQGHFGLGVQSQVYGMNYPTGAVEAFPLIRRYPGLTYGSDNLLNLQRNDALLTDPASDGIWDINWLTAISDYYVQRSGALRQALADPGEAVTVHRYDGGVVLQAGDSPQSGDLDRNLIPPAYVEVERMIQSVRFTKITSPFIACPPSVDALEVSHDYVDRFRRYL